MVGRCVYVDPQRSTSEVFRRRSMGALLDGKQAIRFTGSMKATIDVPDDLYRQVKAKSALEGRPVREVAIELFRNYVGQETAQPGAADSAAGKAARAFEGSSIPSWFGILEQHARRVERHDMDTIRESIARGVSTERDL